MRLRNSNGKTRCGPRHLGLTPFSLPQQIFPSAARNTWGAGVLIDTEQRRAAEGSRERTPLRPRLGNILRILMLPRSLRADVHNMAAPRGVPRCSV